MLAHVCLGELRDVVSHLTMRECIEQRKTTLTDAVAEALGLLERAQERLAAAKMVDWDAKAWDELVAALARLKAPPKAATPSPR